MSTRINTNTTAFDASVNLSKNTAAESQDIQRLSSGPADQLRRRRPVRLRPVPEPAGPVGFHHPGHEQHQRRHQRSQDRRRRVDPGSVPLGQHPPDHRPGRQRRNQQLDRADRRCSGRFRLDQQHRPHRFHDPVQRQNSAGRLRQRFRCGFHPPVQARSPPLWVKLWRLRTRPTLMAPVLFPAPTSYSSPEQPNLRQSSLGHLRRSPPTLTAARSRLTAKP